MAYTLGEQGVLKLGSTSTCTMCFRFGPKSISHVLFFSVWDRSGRHHRGYHLNTPNGIVEISSLPFGSVQLGRVGVEVLRYEYYRRLVGMNDRDFKRGMSQC